MPHHNETAASSLSAVLSLHQLAMRKQASLDQITKDPASSIDDIDNAHAEMQAATDAMYDVHRTHTAKVSRNLIASSNRDKFRVIEGNRDNDASGV